VVVVAVLAVSLVAACANEAADSRSSGTSVPTAAEVGACPREVNLSGLPLSDTFASRATTWTRLIRLDPVGASGNGVAATVDLSAGQVLDQPEKDPSPYLQPGSRPAPIRRETLDAAQQETRAGHPLVVGVGAGGVGTVVSMRRDGPVFVGLCGFETGTEPLREAAHRLAVDPEVLLMRAIGDGGASLVHSTASSATTTPIDQGPGNGRSTRPR